MTLSESQQIKHHYEAERMLQRAADLTFLLFDTARPLTEGRRERVESELEHLERQALAHSNLAKILLPPHTEDEVPV